VPPPVEQPAPSVVLCSPPPPPPPKPGPEPLVDTMTSIVAIAVVPPSPVAVTTRRCLEDEAPFGEQPRRSLRRELALREQAFDRDAALARGRVHRTRVDRSEPTTSDLAFGASVRQSFLTFLVGDSDLKKRRCARSR
jgi:hypothetical protein